MITPLHERRRLHPGARHLRELHRSHKSSVEYCLVYECITAAADREVRLNFDGLSSRHL